MICVNPADCAGLFGNGNGAFMREACTLSRS